MPSSYYQVPGYSHPVEQYRIHRRGVSYGDSVVNQDLPGNCAALHYQYGRGFRKYGCSADGGFAETRGAIMFFFGAVLFLRVKILANNDGCNRCSRCSDQIVLYIEARANFHRFGTHILARCLGHFAKILLDAVHLLCPVLPDNVGNPEFARSYGYIV